MHNSYLLYGATGYTGRLIAREAVRRGARPILGGRNAAKLAAVADEFDLEHIAFAVDDPTAIDAALEGTNAVLNCAGPFERTADAMVEACLRTRKHCVDITGEIDVLTRIHGRDAEAKKQGVVLLPGSGFDVVPTDCMAARVKKRMPEARHLALVVGLFGPAGVSRGTFRTSMAGMKTGGRARRGGRIVEVPMGSPARSFDFGDERRVAHRLPMGDVFTAGISTGIPDIDLYATLPRFARVVPPRMLRPALATAAGQWLLERVAGFLPEGPTEEQRRASRSAVLAIATDAGGKSITEQWHGPDPYTLTARSATEIIERVLAETVRPGAHTPSSAFGEAFLRERWVQPDSIGP